MTDHLSPAQLSALADNELSADELDAARKHLEGCLDCSHGAIDEYLLKAAVAKAGRTYDVPGEFRDRMANVIARNVESANVRSPDMRTLPFQSRRKWTTWSGWAAAAVLFLVMGSWVVVQFRQHNTFVGERAALINEACDLHIAMLAANEPPQVVSSDRHTVKPWFQGKLTFSFNLPEALPSDTTLDGANLAYLDNRPVAQLLFSIGRHRVSVFVEQKYGSGGLRDFRTARSGFQVAGFDNEDLEVIAVSDVDPARLAALLSALQAAQVR
jgi:anti-sigma factor RsiW